MKIITLLICGLYFVFFNSMAAGEDRLKEITFPTELQHLGQYLGLPLSRNWKEAREHFSVWGRSNDQERWELKNARFSPDVTAKISHSLKTLGFINTISPQKNNYDYALVLGGTVPSMIKRMNFLVEQWKSGTRFKHLVFLTGQRPLSPLADHFTKNIAGISKEAAETHWKDKTLPTDESEAAQLIYALAEIPEEMRNLPVTFSLTPRTWLISQKHWQRANTATTVHTWIQQNRPEPGKVLAISSQPSIHYQSAVIRESLPASFALDTAGPACTWEIPLSVKLDAVSLWLKHIPYEK